LEQKFFTHTAEAKPRLRRAHSFIPGKKLEYRRSQFQELSLGFLPIGKSGSIKLLDEHIDFPAHPT
jgi:hypothetical protein